MTMDSEGSTVTWTWALAALAPPQGGAQARAFESAPWLAPEEHGMRDLECDAAQRRRRPTPEREEDVDVETNEDGGNCSGDASDEDEEEAFRDVLCFLGSLEADARATLRAQLGRQRSAFQVKRHENEASKSWDTFYRRNTTNFFKDRHYLLKVFPVLGAALRERTHGKEPVRLLEVGCGVGNTMLPLTQAFEHLTAYGIDFAPKAVALLNEQNHPRCRGFVADASRADPPLPKEIPLVDFATFLFVLSAVEPQRMLTAVQSVLAKMRPGGMVLFRDYAEMDQAQLRFSVDQRLGFNYYVRQDGTRSFFFTLDGVRMLFEQQAGLQCVDARIVRRLVVNHALGSTMRRVFVNATFRVPACASPL